MNENFLIYRLNKVLIMKICKKCQTEKDISEYYLRNGRIKSSYCKECYGLVYKKKYNPDYYLQNKEKFKENYKNWLENNDRSEYSKKYKSDNHDILRSKNKKYREDNIDSIKEKKKKYWENLSLDKKEEIKERSRINQPNYRERKRTYVNNRRNVDPLFKLSFNIRSLIKNSIKRHYGSKSKKTLNILGCPFEELKSYLESKFDENMNWGNYGSYWEIDHIIPISSAKSEEDIYNLNHYTNLQPLYWLDNLKKSNNVNT